MLSVTWCVVLSVCCAVSDLVCCAVSDLVCCANNDLVCCAGSISALTVGDLPLDTLKQRQEEGKDIASKPREREEEESPVEPPVPTLQTTDLDKEYAMGDTLWK